MLNNKVFKTPINRITVEGGDVIKNIKLGDKGYIGFGETYYSIIYFNKKKGWKRHLKMTLNLTCPMGAVRFVFSADLKKFQDIVLDENNFYRITIHPGIWFAFEGLHKPYSIVNNVADMVHNPIEIERKDFKEVDFFWDQEF